MREKPASRGLFAITKASAKDFSRDQCGLRAAALCYYTAFALPPLLILLIKLAGLVWDPQTIQHALESQFSGLVGSGGATTVSQMVAGGQRHGHGALSTVASFVGLLFGATGAFLSLQQALNAVWEVAPDPKQGGVKRFITKRLLSLGMLLGLAFLLIVSLAVTAAVSAIGGAIGGAGVVMQIANTVASLIVLTLLFAAMFKFLPDATIGWRSVWVGGLATAVLFEIGKFVIGLYLGHSNPGNAFGAASSFAVILVWIYYAGMLVLFGAEFTQHFARARGHGVRPKEGAVRIEREQRVVRDEGDTTTESGAAPPARGHSGGHPAMATDGRGDGRGIQRSSIPELLRQLSDDGSRLVQQEIRLAKVELREDAANAANGAGKIGAATVLALPGLLALTAAAIIGLSFLVGSSWLSALIVGVIVLAVAGLLLRSAISSFRSGLVPRETVETLREDVAWAKRETRHARHEMSA